MQKQEGLSDPFQKQVRDPPGTDALPTPGGKEHPYLQEGGLGEGQASPAELPQVTTLSSHASVPAGFPPLAILHQSYRKNTQV